MKKIDLTKLSYQQLEEESDNILKQLSDPEIGLDESAKLYQYGRQVAEEMDKRLSELEASVKDTIEQD